MQDLSASRTGRSASFQAGAVPAWDVADSCGERHRESWEITRFLHRVSSIERVRNCRRVPYASLVGIVARPDGRAHLSCLQTCGSIWDCPSCSAKIEATRADELGQAFRSWDERGGTIALLTLTMRHERGQALEELWDGLSDAWRSASGAAKGRVQNAMAAAGVAGWVRKVEVTHGANGWHVHVHVALFIEPGAPEDLTPLGDAAFMAWARRLKARGLDAPIAASGGLDLRRLDLGQAMEHAAGYLAKTSFEAVEAVSSDDVQVRRAARELTGSATKRAGRGNRTPFGVLADLQAFGLADDFAIWREWEQGSKGRRAMNWSQGMRDLVLDDAEKDDEQIAAETDAAGVTVALLQPAGWRELYDAGPRAIAAVLSTVEACPTYEAVAAAMGALGLRPPLRPPQEPQDE
jgi:hypothetical protein